MNIIFVAAVFLTEHGMAQDLSNPGLGSQSRLVKNPATEKRTIEATPVKQQPDMAAATGNQQNAVNEQHTMGAIPNLATADSGPGLFSSRVKMEQELGSQSESAKNPATDKQTIEATPVKQQPAMAAATSNQQNAVNEQPTMEAIPNLANADSGHSLSSNPVKMEKGLGSQSGSAKNPSTDKQTIEAAPVKQQPPMAAATGNQQNAVNEQPTMESIPNVAIANSGPGLSSSPVKMEQDLGSQSGLAKNPATDKQTIEATPVKQQPAMAAATGNQQNAVNEQPPMEAIPNLAIADSGPGLSSSPVKMEQGLDSQQQMFAQGFPNHADNPIADRVQDQPNGSKKPAAITNPAPQQQPLPLIPGDKMEQGSDQFADDHQIQSKEKGFENSQDTVLPSSATREESFQNNPQSSRVTEGLDDKLGFELKSIVSQMEDMKKDLDEALREGDDV